MISEVEEAGTVTEDVEDIIIFRTDMMILIILVDVEQVEGVEVEGALIDTITETVKWEVVDGGRTVAVHHQ